MCVCVMGCCAKVMGEWGRCVCVCDGVGLVPR